MSLLVNKWLSCHKINYMALALSYACMVVFSCISWGKILLFDEMRYEILLLILQRKYFGLYKKGPKKGSLWRPFSVPLEGLSATKKEIRETLGGPWGDIKAPWRTSSDPPGDVNRGEFEGDREGPLWAFTWALYGPFWRLFLTKGHRGGPWRTSKGARGPTKGPFRALRGPKTAPERHRRGPGKGLLKGLPPNQE